MENYTKLVGQYVKIKKEFVETYNYGHGDILIEAVEYREERQRWEAKENGTINWFPVTWIEGIWSSNWSDEKMHHVTTYTPVEEFLNPINEEPLTAKDLEVQETVQQAMELDVAPLGDLCPKCEWPTGICICTKQVHNAAKELGEYVQKWSKEHGLHTHILNHK
jgi:hypothetical protein